MTFKELPDDILRRVLERLTEGHMSSTYRISQCAMPGRRSEMRALLRRMERRGLVEGIATESGRVYWWKITDLGRTRLRHAMPKYFGHAAHLAGEPE